MKNKWNPFMSITFALSFAASISQASDELDELKAKLPKTLQQMQQTQTISNRSFVSEERPLYSRMRSVFLKLVAISDEFSNNDRSIIESVNLFDDNKAGKFREIVSERSELTFASLCDYLFKENNYENIELEKISSLLQQGHDQEEEDTLKYLTSLYEALSDNAKFRFNELLEMEESDNGKYVRPAFADLVSQGGERFINSLKQTCLSKEKLLNQNYENNVRFIKMEVK